MVSPRRSGFVLRLVRLAALESGAGVGGPRYPAPGGGVAPFAACPAAHDVGPDRGDEFEPVELFGFAEDDARRLIADVAGWCVFGEGAGEEYGIEVAWGALGGD